MFFSWNSYAKYIEKIYKNKLTIIHYQQWSLIQLSSHLHGHFSQSYFVHKHLNNAWYRSGTVNSNTVNSKFHLIWSFFEIFDRFLLFHV